MPKIHFVHVASSLSHSFTYNQIMNAPPPVGPARCGFDYVAVYAGNTTEAHQIGRFCGYTYGPPNPGFHGEHAASVCDYQVSGQ